VRLRDGTKYWEKIFLSEFLLCFGTVVIFYIIKLGFFVMDFMFQLY